VVAALSALALLALPALAAAKDRNHDRIPDRWERRHHLSLHVKQNARDQDRDHLRNRGEFLADMNPRDRDTDGDGVMDGDENAGTIQSFDPETGRLVIDLFGGDTIAGTVNADTEIRCGHDHGGASASDEGSSGPGSGDDPAGEPGDDPSGHDEGDDPAGEPGEGPAGHDEGDDNHGTGGGEGRSCGAEALVVGATVEEAELELRNGTATFEEIDLAHEGGSTG
jgi:hypothetical protein